MIRLNFHKTLQAPHGEMDLHLDLEIDRGQLVTLYGESGAGKTSALRILSGLMKPDSGHISVNGRTWFDSANQIHLKPQQRQTGFVFQDYALFPHMTVRQNLDFAVGRRKGREIVPELLEAVELGELQHRKPGTLSGGQQQRVALARALVRRPELLLLDEPLSALDMKIRLKLQEYILKLHRSFGLTTILVSHDLGEIHRLSDRVITLKKGAITRQGAPAEIFVEEKISGKFKFSGEIINIEPQEVVYIVTVLVHSEIVKVIAQEAEIEGMDIGDRVIVASKAFNPVIYKME